MRQRREKKKDQNPRHRNQRQRGEHAGNIEAIARLDDPERVAREFHLRLGLRVNVRTVGLGTLPRFEGKGRRVLDERAAATRRVVGQAEEKGEER